MKILAMMLLFISPMFCFNAVLMNDVNTSIVAGSSYPIIFELTPSIAGKHIIELVFEYEGKEYNQTRVWGEKNCSQTQAGVHRCECDVVSADTRCALNFSFYPGVIVSNYSLVANFYQPTPSAASAPVSHSSAGATGGVAFLRPFVSPSPSVKPEEPKEQTPPESKPQPQQNPIKNTTKPTANTTEQKVEEKPVVNMNLTRPAQQLTPSEFITQEYEKTPLLFQFAVAVVAVVAFSFAVAMYVFSLYRKKSDLPSDRMKKIIDENEKKRVD